MRFILLVFLFFKGSCLLAVDPAEAAKSALLSHAEASVSKAFAEKNYRAAISELNKRIPEAKDPAANYVLLALAQLADQQEEEAFTCFMQAIKLAKPTKRVASSSEVKIYTELLPLYHEANPEFQKKLGEQISHHPDYLYLQFFLATNFANERKFEQFFCLFYRSYLAYPDCYMANKSKGVLASLLMQRTRDFEIKQKWRSEALSSFQYALTQCPQDVALHKMMLCTATSDEKKEVIHSIIDQIVRSDSKIPRAEIPFYITQALEVDDITSAKALYQKATTWYQYSRNLQEMQRLIDEKEKK